MWVLDNRIVLEKVVYTAANTICCTYINTSGEVQTQKKIETYLVTRCEKGRPTGYLWNGKSLSWIVIILIILSILFSNGYSSHVFEEIFHL